ncbi:unnamed protein product [Ilex paraguariensis]|uniref:Target of rapamycin complex subunit LST8 n=1 Tax=Ilex paraguariensis TaxID=185542 RepID=A0ABC8S9E6_9AQUA
MRGITWPIHRGSGTRRTWPRKLLARPRKHQLSLSLTSRKSLSENQVLEVDTAVRSLTVIWDGNLVVAANNRGTCYVWRLLRGMQTMTNFEPLNKLQTHDGYIGQK